MLSWPHQCFKFSLQKYEVYSFILPQTHNVYNTCECLCCDICLWPCQVLADFSGIATHDTLPLLPDLCNMSCTLQTEKMLSHCHCHSSCSPTINLLKNIFSSGNRTAFLVTIYIYEFAQQHFRFWLLYDKFIVDCLLKYPCLRHINFRGNITKNQNTVEIIDLGRIKEK